jgi:hypothetical protein
LKSKVLRLSEDMVTESKRGEGVKERNSSAGRFRPSCASRPDPLDYPLGVVKKVLAVGDAIEVSQRAEVERGRCASLD